MLPPIAPAVLERNPKFKLLYEDMSQNKINPDASTKDVKRQRLVDQAREDLNAKRTDLAKTQILKTSLESLSARASDLPDELHEVITIVAAQLNGHIPSSDREILQEDVAYFTDHVVPISRALSTHLRTITLQLCRIASPETADPSIPALPAIAHAQLATATDATTVLATQRTALADLAAAVLDAQTRLGEVVVRALEQTIHGSAARAARAKAEHLAAVAKGLELKLAIVTLTSGGAEQQGEEGGSLANAVANYERWLEGEREELAHRRRIAEDRLEEFEEAGGNGKAGMMREIARRYAEVEEEIARVRGELGRLEGEGR